MPTGATTIENSIEVPQKIQNRATVQSSNSTSGYFSQENKNINMKIYMHPYIIAVLCTKAKTWKQLKCPSKDKWIKKKWYIYNGILLSHKKE